MDTRAPDGCLRAPGGWPIEAGPRFSDSTRMRVAVAFPQVQNVLARSRAVHDDVTTSMSDIDVARHHQGTSPRVSEKGQIAGFGDQKRRLSHKNSARLVEQTVFVPMGGDSVAPVIISIKCDKNAAQVFVTQRRQVVPMTREIVEIVQAID